MASFSHPPSPKYLIIDLPPEVRVMFMYQDASPILYHSNNFVVGDDGDEYGALSVREFHQFLHDIPASHLVCIRHVELKSSIADVLCQDHDHLVGHWESRGVGRLELLRQTSTTRPWNVVQNEDLEAGHDLWKEEDIEGPPGSYSRYVEEAKDTGNGGGNQVLASWNLAAHQIVDFVSWSAF
ncbi:hypothetical protein BDZ45DRAFT_742720 [Acephala macrosclerotiorum]|nr:hypothetical protein BDZ45DRAFT_742720 [Acephala macrosclerotiorum]